MCRSSIVGYVTSSSSSNLELLRKTSANVRNLLSENASLKESLDNVTSDHSTLQYRYDELEANYKHLNAQYVTMRSTARVARSTYMDMRNSAKRYINYCENSAILIPDPEIFITAS